MDGRRGERQQVLDRGARRDGGDREQQDDEPADRHRQRQRIRPDEAARLLDLVGDVEPGDDARRPLARPVDRQGERDREAQPLGRFRAGGEALELVGDERRRVARQAREQLADMLGDRAGIRREPIDQHHRGQQRHEGEKSEKGDPRGEEPHIVVARLAPRAREHGTPFRSRRPANRFKSHAAQNRGGARGFRPSFDTGLPPDQVRGQSLLRMSGRGFLPAHPE
jgi:hypothetical protein